MANYTELNDAQLEAVSGGFLDATLAKGLKERERRARRLLELDDAVGVVVEALKQKGLVSPYLKSFVVARINFVRWKKEAELDFDETVDELLRLAKKIDAGKVTKEDVAKAGGAPDTDD